MPLLFVANTVEFYVTKKILRLKIPFSPRAGGGGLKTILQWFGHIKFIPDRSPTGKALRPKR